MVFNTISTPGDASASALEEDWENVTRAEAIAEAILEAALRQGKNSEILVLDKQSLTSLPDDFGRWEETKRFKQLMLNQNALSKLPDSMGEMTELNTLELGSNKLETFPPSMANLKKLKVLYINNNPMKELPGCIYEMKSLERLDIANTKITNINIAAFPNLLILYINENGNSELLENIQGALANNKSLKFKIMFRS
ncbi:MAG: leucine-rich repeat domain-containing protein [Rhabdochlamydiaceae bacterium]|jgi:Leucine-rich repeat (LRR) protein